MAAPVLGRDPYSSDMAGVILFEQADYKARHGAILGNDPVRNGLVRGEQVFKGVATVSFAIDKATLIKAPAFIDLRNRKRAQIVVRIDGRNQRDIGLVFRMRRLASIEPPSRTKLFQNCHSAKTNPRKNKSVAEIIARYLRWFTSVRARKS